MKNKHFNAVRRGTFGGQSASVLQQWIQRYIKALFPEWEFYWWNTNERSDSAHCLKPGAVLPAMGCDSGAIAHFACYVHSGSNEGEMVEVAFVLRTGQMLNLMTGKSFQTREECCLMATAIETALDHIFGYHEIPEIVDLAAKIPRKYSWGGESRLAGPVQVQVGDRTLKVIDASGLVLDDRDFDHVEGTAKYAIEAYAKDWRRLLEVAQVKVAEPEEFADVAAAA